MSEFESTTTASTLQSASTDERQADRRGVFHDAGAPAKAEREGLPAGYRMRADAHYVDQLASRSAGSPVRLIPPQEIDGPDSVAPNLEALTQSIGAHGMLQPLLVRRQNGRYSLIAGRNRLAAARAAGLGQVPCLVHQVDEAEAAALAEAESLRGLVRPETRADRSAGIDAQWTDEVARHLGAIRSAAALLITEGRSVAHTIGVDLVRAEAWRAQWFIKAQGLMAGTGRLRRRSCSVAPLVGRVLDGFAAESRLTRIDIRANIRDGNLTAEVDEEAFVVGVTGAAIATLNLIDRANGSAITVTATSGGTDAIAIDVAQDSAIGLPAAGRFFDPAWAERPGGWTTLAGALCAKTVAEMHGGGAQLDASARGTILRMRLARVC